MKKISVEDIDDLIFWVNYSDCCYPNCYDEEEVQPARKRIAEQMKFYFPESL